MNELNIEGFSSSGEQLGSSITCSPLQSALLPFLQAPSQSCHLGISYRGAFTMQNFVNNCERGRTKEVERDRKREATKSSRKEEKKKEQAPDSQAPRLQLPTVPSLL